MDKQFLAQVLAKLRFSASLPEEVLERLSTFAILREYPAGSHIFHEGDIGDSLLIISSGRIALEMNVPGRGNRRILTLGPGDLVAWSSLLADGRMTTSAMALEDTQVVVISASEVLSACGTNRDFGYFFMRRVACALAERLQATRLQLLDSMPDASRPHLPVPKSRALDVGPVVNLRNRDNLATRLLRLDADGLFEGQEIDQLQARVEQPFRNRNRDLVHQKVAERMVAFASRLQRLGGKRNHLSILQCCGGCRHFAAPQQRRPTDDLPRLESHDPDVAVLGHMDVQSDAADPDDHQIIVFRVLAK